MYVDNEGVVHPLVLVPEIESHDVYYASCKTCGSRWAGPFRSLTLATEVVQLANASAYYDLPARVRSSSPGLCHGPDGLPIGTPGAMSAHDVAADTVPSQAAQAAQAAHDVGKVFLLTCYVVFAMTRIIVLFVIGIVRLVSKLGATGTAVVGASVLVALFGLRAAVPHAPDATTSAMGVVGVLVALGVVTVLARGLRGKLTESVHTGEVTRTGYSTPLTTAKGVSSVSPATKPPGGELPAE